VEVVPQRAHPCDHPRQHLDALPLNGSHIEAGQRLLLTARATTDSETTRNAQAVSAQCYGSQAVIGG
jgi:hypothetical protein